MTTARAKLRKIAPDDRIMSPAASATDAAWRAAVATVDKACIDVEARWGSIARLLRSASPDTASKMASAWHKFEVAMEEARQAVPCTMDHVTEVAKRGAVVARGLKVAEDEAKLAGISPLPSRWLAYDEATGNEASRHMIVVATDDEAAAARKEWPASIVVSCREVLALLDIDRVSNVKALFPDAVVKEVRVKPEPSALSKELQDEIPF